MTLLDARKLVSKKVDELKSRVDKLSKKPSLVIIRVGDDFASGKYVANKIKKCDEVGIDSKIIHFVEKNQAPGGARVLLWSKVDYRADEVQPLVGGDAQHPGDDFVPDLSHRCNSLRIGLRKVQRRRRSTAATSHQKAAILAVFHADKGFSTFTSLTRSTATLSTFTRRRVSCLKT